MFGRSRREPTSSVTNVTDLTVAARIERFGPALCVLIHSRYSDAILATMSNYIALAFQDLRSLSGPVTGPGATAPRMDYRARCTARNWPVRAAFSDLRSDALGITTDPRLGRKHPQQAAVLPQDPCVSCWPCRLWEGIIPHTYSSAFYPDTHHPCHLLQVASTTMAGALLAILITLPCGAPLVGPATLALRVPPEPMLVPAGLANYSLAAVSMVVSPHSRGARLQCPANQSVPSADRSPPALNNLSPRRTRQRATTYAQLVLLAWIAVAAIAVTALEAFLEARRLLSHDAGQISSADGEMPCKHPAKKTASASASALECSPHGTKEAEPPRMLSCPAPLLPPTTLLDLPTLLLAWLAIFPRVASAAATILSVPKLFPDSNYQVWLRNFLNVFKKALPRVWMIAVGLVTRPIELTLQMAISIIIEEHLAVQAALAAAGLTGVAAAAAVAAARLPRRRDAVAEPPATRARRAAAAAATDDDDGEGAEAPADDEDEQTTEALDAAAAADAAPALAGIPSPSDIMKGAHALLKENKKEIAEHDGNEAVLGGYVEAALPDDEANQCSQQHNGIGTKMLAAIDTDRKGRGNEAAEIAVAKLHAHQLINPDCQANSQELTKLHREIEYLLNQGSSHDDADALPNPRQLADIYRRNISGRQWNMARTAIDSETFNSSDWRVVHAALWRKLRLDERNADIHALLPGGAPPREQHIPAFGTAPRRAPEGAGDTTRRSRDQPPPARNREQPPQRQDRRVQTLNFNDGGGWKTQCPRCPAGATCPPSSCPRAAAGARCSGCGSTEHGLELCQEARRAGVPGGGSGRNNPNLRAADRDAADVAAGFQPRTLNSAARRARSAATPPSTRAPRHAMMAAAYAGDDTDEQHADSAPDLSRADKENALTYAMVAQRAFASVPRSEDIGSAKTALSVDNPRAFRTVPVLGKIGVWADDSDEDSESLSSLGTLDDGWHSSADSVSPPFNRLGRCSTPPSPLRLEDAPVDLGNPLALSMPAPEPEMFQHPFITKPRALCAKPPSILSRLQRKAGRSSPPPGLLVKPESAPKYSRATLARAAAKIQARARGRRCRRSLPNPVSMARTPLNPVSGNALRPLRTGNSMTMRTVHLALDNTITIAVKPDDTVLSVQTRLQADYPDALLVSTSNHHPLDMSLNIARAENLFLKTHGLGGGGGAVLQHRGIPEPMDENIVDEPAPPIYQTVIVGPTHPPAPPIEAAATTAAAAVHAMLDDIVAAIENSAAQEIAHEAPAPASSAAHAGHAFSSADIFGPTTDDEGDDANDDPPNVPVPTYTTVVCWRADDGSMQPPDAYEPTPELVHSEVDALPASGEMAPPPPFPPPIHIGPLAPGAQVAAANAAAAAAMEALAEPMTDNDSEDDVEDADPRKNHSKRARSSPSIEGMTPLLQMALGIGFPHGALCSVLGTATTLHPEDGVLITTAVHAALMAVAVVTALSYARLATKIDGARRFMVSMLRTTLTAPRPWRYVRKGEAALFYADPIYLYPWRAAALSAFHAPAAPLFFPQLSQATPVCCDAAVLADNRSVWEHKWPAWARLVESRHRPTLELQWWEERPCIVAQQSHVASVKITISSRRLDRFASWSKNSKVASLRRPTIHRAASVHIASNRIHRPPTVPNTLIRPRSTRIGYNGPRSRLARGIRRAHIGARSPPQRRRGCDRRVGCDERSLDRASSRRQLVRSQISPRKSRDSSCAPFHGGACDGIRGAPAAVGHACKCSIHGRHLRLWRRGHLVAGRPHATPRAAASDAAHRARGGRRAAHYRGRTRGGE